MTLILSMANMDRTIQVADCRITSLVGNMEGTSLTETAVKGGAIRCGDARLAYSFCGLAFVGASNQRSFDMILWLRSAILLAARPTFSAEEMIRNLAIRLTVEFSTNPEILKLPASARRLSVMFSGYKNTAYGTIYSGWIITNFQRSFDIDPTMGGPNTIEARPDFGFLWWHEPHPAREGYAHVERLGDWRRVPHSGMLDLHNGLKANLPLNAMIGIAQRVIRQASNASGGHSIGKSISVIVIPRDIEKEVIVRYEPDLLTNQFLIPDMLIATSADHCNWFTLEIESAVTPDSPYAFVPRTNRKAPCPCKSGRIYGKCHGSKKTRKAKKFRYVLTKVNLE